MLLSSLSHSKYHEADKGDNPDGITEPQTGTEPKKTEEKQFSQSELEAIVKDRLERAKRKAKEDADKAKADADQKALAEQGEFKTLAEQRAAELETTKRELETAKTHEQAADKYRKALKDRLDVEKKAYPAHVVSLLDKLDPLEQLEWITANADALKPATDRTHGTPPRSAGKPAHAPVSPSSATDVDNRPRFTLG